MKLNKGITNNKNKKNREKVSKQKELLDGRNILKN